MKRQKLIDFRGKRTQTEMAQRYGVSQQLWSCWENGETLPEAPIMLRLEKDSGIPMEELFFDKFNDETTLEKSEESQVCDEVSDEKLLEILYKTADMIQKRIAQKRTTRKAK